MSVTKQPISRWINNFINGLLIFCVGGIGPLTYFDGFSPHHSHPFHLSIFGSVPDHEQGSHCHGLGELDYQQQPVEQWRIDPAARLTTVYTADPQTTSGFAHFFQSGLSHGFLLTGTELDIGAARSLYQRMPAGSLTERSIWLPPPKKPPSLSFAFALANKFWRTA